MSREWQHRLLFIVLPAAVGGVIGSFTSRLLVTGHWLAALFLIIGGLALMYVVMWHGSLAWHRRQNRNTR